MLNNTLVIYTTDNGGPIVPTTGAPDDAVGASNYPLRGGKHNPYEGGVKATAWFWDGRGILHPQPPAPSSDIKLVHEKLRDNALNSNVNPDVIVTAADLPPENIGLRFEHSIRSICGVICDNGCLSFLIFLVQIHWIGPRC